MLFMREKTGGRAALAATPAESWLPVLARTRGITTAAPHGISPEFTPADGGSGLHEPPWTRSMHQGSTQTAPTATASAQTPARFTGLPFIKEKNSFTGSLKLRKNLQEDDVDLLRFL
jgi:hypothetical protein